MPQKNISFSPKIYWFFLRQKKIIFVAKNSYFLSQKRIFFYRNRFFYECEQKKAAAWNNFSTPDQKIAFFLTQTENFPIQARIQRIFPGLNLWISEIAAIWIWIRKTSSKTSISWFSKLKFLQAPNNVIFSLPKVV